MSDIVAARPVAGAAIETGWGTEVHDQIEGIQAGVATVTWASSADATQAVTFPRAYASPPVVLVAIHTGVTRVIIAKVTAGSVTTTGFTIAGQRTDGTAMSGAIPCSWLAIGTPA